MGRYEMSHMQPFDTTQSAPEVRMIVEIQETLAGLAGALTLRAEQAPMHRRPLPGDFSTGQTTFLPSIAPSHVPARILELSKQIKKEYSELPDDDKKLAERFADDF